MSDAAETDWTSTLDIDRSLRQLLSGSGFADVFVRRFEALRRIAAGMGLNAADAEEVLHDVFLEAWRRPGQYRGAESAFRWLMRVTVNRCRLEHRRRKRWHQAAEAVRQSQSQTNEGVAAAPDADADRAEQLDLVRAGLDEMDESLRMLLVLRYFCELNATQIGEMLEMPSGTVRSRLRDARLNLAERLKHKGIKP